MPLLPAVLRCTGTARCESAPAGVILAPLADHDSFGATGADRYDENVARMFDPAVVEPTVSALAALAQGGAALELGIGTGRIALPVSRRGVDVRGIDLSEAMVAKLREKPGGDRIPVTIGDFAGATVDGRFDVVYLVFNTIMNLTSQEAQVACFENAAAHLVPGGCFVVEVMVPDLQRLPPGETIRPFEISPTRWGFDEYDTPTQRLVSHHLLLPEADREKPAGGPSDPSDRDAADGGLRRWSVSFRYVWPSELDLMARIAGLALESRWADWHGTPFSADSRSHVSVWRRAQPSVPPSAR